MSMHSKYSGQIFIMNFVTISFLDSLKIKETKPTIICNCGNIRLSNYNSALAIIKGKNHGRCKLCYSKEICKSKQRKFTKVKDEVLESDSIIHWSKRDSNLDKNQKVPVTCGKCKNIRLLDINRKTTWTGCCYKCNTRFGDNHPSWKGGRIYDDNNYILIHNFNLSEDEKILFKSMYNNYSYIFEHRLIVARHLHRPLENYEKVHHLNEIKDDNRIQNLQLISSKNHAKEHQKMLKGIKAEVL